MQRNLKNSHGIAYISAIDAMRCDARPNHFNSFFKIDSNNNANFYAS